MLRMALMVVAEMQTATLIIAGGAGDHGPPDPTND